MTVIVVGSANMDLVYRVAALPAPGETVMSIGTARHPGGKGNNQAIASARAGASTSFIASIGRDADGDTLVAALEEAGVVGLLRRPDRPTGTALITVDDRGENMIVVDAGANADLVDLDDRETEAIAAADVVLMQLEIPLPTVIAAASTARHAGTSVVLNAAPFADLPSELLTLVDVLVVNEHEAAALGDERRALVPASVVTLGRRGALVHEHIDHESSVGGTIRDGVLVTAPRVTAVDSTGAGDTFCGALVAALCEGRDLAGATRFATAAAALSVQRHGAVSSIPRRSEIDRLLAELPSGEQS